jgi:hypothetical protein
MMRKNKERINSFIAVNISWILEHGQGDEEGGEGCPDVVELFFFFFWLFFFFYIAFISLTSSFIIIVFFFFSLILLLLLFFLLFLLIVILLLLLLIFHLLLLLPSFSLSSPFFFYRVTKTTYPELSSAESNLIQIFFLWQFVPPLGSSLQPIETG